jgi:serine-type D-Ala-D-Ala carboxypeptidase/endopeptidase (penicillin-binding protein 4)
MEVRLTPDLPTTRATLSREKLGENVTFAYRGGSGVETWLLSPDEHKEGSDRLPVKNPALFTAHVFRKLCEMRGITLPLPEPGKMPGNADTIDAHQGQKLTDLADITLTFSINLMAELMMLNASKELSGSAGTLESAGRTITGYLSGRMKKTDWKGFRMINGSGLTVKNRITPEQMTSVLVYANSQNYDGKHFRDFLPASGWEWSLMNRLNDRDTAFHVWAKTGSINYALALAGYLYTKSHRSMAFAIFINDAAQRKIYDADPDRRNRESMRRVYTWQNSAKSLMDGIVAGWIREL